MLASIFQNSKYALAFSASVIVCALMLVGPKESGGVLNKAVTTYKDERANIADNAAMTSQQMSTPLIGDYKPDISGLEEPADGGPGTDSAPAGTPRVIRIDPATGLPIGEVPPPPPPAPIIGGQPEAASQAAPAVQNAPAAAEAVVTSRMIRIEPK